VITVLNVLYEERVGGPQWRVLQVAQGLRARGVLTIVTIPRGDQRFANLLRDVGVPFEELDLVRLRQTGNPAVHAKFLVRFWRNVGELRRLIRKHGAQVVHNNGSIHSQAAMAARLEGVRLVWHLNDVGMPKPLRLIFLPLVRSWADRIAIASQAVGQFYFPSPGEVNGRLHLLYAPVDPVRFRPDVDGSGVRAALGVEPIGPLVGSVGNASPGRGWEFLLEAAPQIKERHPAVKFLFVGELLENRRAYWSGLMRRAKDLNLSEDIIFSGRRQDMPQVMRALQLYVHPSDSEACPMSVLEACASGLPVVATDVGGIQEIVQDGVSGCLVPPRSPSEIARAVISLLDSPGLSQRMGRAAAQRVRALFSLPQCVEEHVRVYTAALKAAPRQSQEPPRRVSERKIGILRPQVQDGGPPSR
jgi:glycosyltransferase involved in cell wall biosynthesis